jgi:hypothetical protein
LEVEPIFPAPKARAGVAKARQITMAHSQSVEELTDLAMIGEGIRKIMESDGGMLGWC